MAGRAPNRAAVFTVVRGAYGFVGLNVDEFRAEQPIIPASKIGEIAFHTHRFLGIPMVAEVPHTATVADLVDHAMLSLAPVVWWSERTLFQSRHLRLIFAPQAWWIGLSVNQPFHELHLQPLPCLRLAIRRRLR